MSDERHAAIYYLLRMGFNPFRRRTARRSDVLLVVATIGVAIILVLWAALAR